MNERKRKKKKQRYNNVLLPSKLLNVLNGVAIAGSNVAEKDERIK
jgi:hypothetical protein